ncbi:hypothetical protein [Flagellimonas aurea]|nr:hypothetical protein [Allomuricauda aurea]
MTVSETTVEKVKVPEAIADAGLSDTYLTRQAESIWNPPFPPQRRTCLTT